jgi:hypothetical protein
MRNTCTALLVALLAFPGVQAAAEEITREQAAELMEWCQRERAQKIAPLKAEAIEKCVNEQGWDRETCETRNRNWGERRRGPNGMLPGMFWDSELCTKALASENYFEANPGAQSYTPR